MKLNEVLERYDKAVAFYLHEMKMQNKSENTMILYTKELKYFRDFFESTHAGDEEVKDPGYLDFQMWRDSMNENGLSLCTMNRYMADVRSFFSFVSDPGLGEMRFYENNQFSSRIIPSNIRAEKRPYDEILSDDDVVKLWDNTPKKGKGIKTRNWPRNYAIVMLLLTTEIRNKELLDLRLSDLDFEYGEIQVQHGKGDKYRCVDMPEMAQTAVKLYLQSGTRPSGLSDDDYLFGTTSAQEFGTNERNGQWKRGTHQWLRDLVKRHVRLVTGVEEVGTHDLRHVGARLDLHNGVSPIELQYKLGHSNFHTTQIYCGKLKQSRKRASAERVYQERDIQTARNKRMVV